MNAVREDLLREPASAALARSSMAVTAGVQIRDVQSLLSPSSLQELAIPEQHTHCSHLRNLEAAITSS